MEQLLTTKLYIPPTRPQLVSRHRLNARLNEGVHRKLTLISAPAGFGKTTLISAWINNLRLDAAKENLIVNKIAWVSLDKSDRDPARFLAYFVAALNRAEGVEINIGEGSLSMLQSPQPPHTETIITSLINDVATIPDRIILILDDYHVIESSSVDKMLSFLVEHLPPQIHLIISTREDPPLPLARLRARGQLTELRAADLRFTFSESAEFLNQMMGLNLSENDITVLETRTEGWIAGLQLAAISMRGHEDVTGFIKSFTGNHRFVIDYLIEEVLNQQPDEIQGFLLQTAILDQLNDSLCDVLTGLNNGQQILEYLEQANLFIIPLDNERHWYRYHHLFADLLRQRLCQSQPDNLSNLHIKASRWYEQENLPAEAIRHALAGGDCVCAADIAERVWPEWQDGIQAITWLSWVKGLPDELICMRPVLSCAFGWAYLNAGELEAAERKLQEVEDWLVILRENPGAQPIDMVIVDEEQFQALPISVAMAQAYLAQAVGNTVGTVTYVEQALSLLPSDAHYQRAATKSLLGMAHWANGDLEKALIGVQFENTHDRIKGTLVIAEIQKTLGHLNEAFQTCESSRKLAEEFPEPNPIGTEDVHIANADLHRERGDLAAAAQALETAKTLGDKIDLPDWRHRWCMVQAQLKASQGEYEQALALLRQAEQDFVRTPIPVVRPIPAIRARFWIRQGRLHDAQKWAEERDLSVDNDFSYLSEYEHITLIRLLIAQESMQKAIDLLARLQQDAEVGHRQRSLIEIHMLAALAYMGLDDESTALATLEQSLVFAEPEGFIRIFVDEGPPMARLLYEALVHGIAPDYVQQMLAAFSNTETDSTTPSKTSTANSELIEPLSEREIEVLQLISEGLTNQEIATRLFLSLHTVKVHARNIYSKLGTHNRTQAVGKARALGLLSVE